jgi:hypothetical protein
MNTYRTQSSEESVSFLRRDAPAIRVRVWDIGTI